MDMDMDMDMESSIHTADEHTSQHMHRTCTWRLLVAYMAARCSQNGNSESASAGRDVGAGGGASVELLAASHVRATSTAEGEDDAVMRLMV